MRTVPGDRAFQIVRELLADESIEIAKPWATKVFLRASVEVRSFKKKSQSGIPDMSGFVLLPVGKAIRFSSLSYPLSAWSYNFVGD